MAHGGKRPNAGRKAKAKTDLPTVNKTIAAEVLAKENEIEAWLELLKAPDTRLRFDVRKYLTDKRDGKAVQTINHLHDKPIEMNVNLSLGERMKSAMEKAEQRLKKS